MDSDSSYLAYGGKGERAGFSTNTNIMDFGVDVFGSETAVRGVSNTGYGVVGESQSTSGVFATGRQGVVGKGLAGPGVEGIGAVDGIGYAAAGVIGRGATRPASQEGVHGPGVVGVAGGKAALPTERVTGNVGVFGQGASGEPVLERGREDASTSPGPGVVGIGGAADLEGFAISAPGVVGFSGNLPRPNLIQVDVLASCGVYGLGAVGVAGEGEAVGVEGKGAIGVKGVGSGDCGGVFQSEAGPQARLVPYRAPNPNNELSKLVPAAAMMVGKPQSSLPADGQAGDLMSIIDSNDRCTLWFCVRAANKNETFDTAQWAQVLLGPSMNCFGQSR